MKKSTKPETRTGKVFTGGGAILIALCLVSNVMVAQFKAATIQELSYLKNPGPNPNYGLLTNSGNDILNASSSGIPFELKVTVWDGAIAGMGWTFTDLNTNIEYSNIEDMPIDMWDPDVCIIQRNSDWYALIAYYNFISNMPFLLVEKFDPINKTWSFINNYALGSGQVQTAINIDSDQKEHFFVVWDQLNGVGQHKIFGAAGAYTNGVGIVLCMNNYEFPAFKEPNGVNAVNFPYTVPDVAVMDLPPQNNNPGQVKVSFMGGTCNAVPTATATLCVTDEFRFTKFGVCNYIPISSNLHYIRYEMPGFQYGWPRIARHRRNGSLSDLQEGFTVVYEKHQPNANLYDIAGLTVFFDYVINPGVLTLFETDNVYTDGSAVFNNDPSQKLPKINNIINRRPVVSYERKSGAVNAGAKQIMCIAFEHAVNYFQGIGWCASFYAHNSDGKPFTETIGQTPNWLFYRVPFVTSNRSYGISVSGEMSEKFMYSFFTFPQQEIRHKAVASFAHLKEGAGLVNNEISISTEILYDNFNPLFINEIYSDMQWTDIQGKLLCNNASEFADIKASLKPGISYMSYRNKEGVHQKVKLVKL